VWLPHDSHTTGLHPRTLGIGPFHVIQNIVELDPKSLSIKLCTHIRTCMHAHVHDLRPSSHLINESPSQHVKIITTEARPHQRPPRPIPNQARINFPRNPSSRGKCGPAINEPHRYLGPRYLATRIMRLKYKCHMYLFLTRILCCG
jgi:hypothetical protein